jgi:sugar phosphate isomerase/epimerase
MASSFPFRLGAPSYVYPADVVPNVVRLAPHVDDVELLLFEVAEPRDLPAGRTIDRLRSLAEENGLTYTVHLPLDLELAASDDEARAASTATARSVIEATRGLDPWAFVVHVRGEGAPAGASCGLAEWEDRATESLGALAEAAGDPEILAVENLTCCPPAAVGALVERLPVSLCLDVGHVLKAGEDPVPILRENLARVRVVHLHAAADGRDHLALGECDRALLRRLVERLTAAEFPGVVTVEVFAENPFFESVELLRTIVEDR